VRYLPQHRLGRIVVLSVAVYLLFCLGMALNQRSFIYLPFAGPTNPEAAGLKNFARAQITAKDGTPIIYWESTGDRHEPTLLYFHGNGGGLHMFLPALDYLNTHGYHVVAMEYRGYPGAPTGKSEVNIVGDGIALFDRLKKSRSGTLPVIWGYSLGSGVATQVAARRAPRALVLEAPFTAVVDRAGEMFPILPVRYIIKDSYLSREAIHDIHAPVFIMHGEADRIVPVHHGRDLFSTANEPKILKTYPGVAHLDLIKSSAYEDAIHFLKSH
jgi:uncharacterized protein